VSLDLVEPNLQNWGRMIRDLSANITRNIGAVRNTGKDVINLMY